MGSLASLLLLALLVVPPAMAGSAVEGVERAPRLLAAPDEELWPLIGAPRATYRAEDGRTILCGFYRTRSGRDLHGCVDAAGRNPAAAPPCYRLVIPGMGGEQFSWARRECRAKEIREYRAVPPQRLAAARELDANAVLRRFELAVYQQRLREYERRLVLCSLPEHGGDEERSTWEGCLEEANELYGFGGPRAPAPDALGRELLARAEARR